MLLFSLEESGKFNISENRLAEGSRNGVNYSPLIRIYGIPEPFKMVSEKIIQRLFYFREPNK